MPALLRDGLTEGRYGRAMEQLAQPLAATATDLFYNPILRKILAGIVAVWLLMMVLGIEVLTSTQHFEGDNSNMYSAIDLGEYRCTYWTGLSFRYRDRPAALYTKCAVWRWGRQVADD